MLFKIKNLVKFILAVIYYFQWISSIDAHPVPDEDCKVIGEIDQLKKSKYPVQSESIAPLFIIAYGLSLYPSFTNIDPLSTHILDTSFGTPKLGIDAHLHMKIPGNHWKFISSRYAEFLKHYNGTKIQMILIDSSTVSSKLDKYFYSEQLIKMEELPNSLNAYVIGKKELTSSPLM